MADFFVADNVFENASFDTSTCFDFTECCFKAYILC